MVDEPVASDQELPSEALDVRPVGDRAGGSHRRTKPGRALAEPSDVAEPAGPSEAAEPAGTSKPTLSAKPAKPAKPARPFWVEAVILLAIAAVIAVGVHSFLFQAFYIPSGSMENTLHVGDRVLVNRLSYKVGHVQRGQVVVFSGVDSWTPESQVTPPHNPVLRELRTVAGYLGFAPSGEQDFIKRVIGVPGDRVTCCDTQGRIQVNGKPLDENYLFPGSNNRTLPFDITVPAGRLWVEGDHRDNSKDSRLNTGLPGGGTIPVNKVVGRAFVVVWPVSHWRGLSVPHSYRALSNAVVSASPSALGLVAVAPLAVMRRRRRRLRSRTT